MTAYTRRFGASMLPLALLAAACVVVHVIAACVVFVRVAHGEGIGDWVAFYSGATILREGSQQHLYDLDFQHGLQQAIFGSGTALAPYVLPAFVAVAMSPISRLSFSASYVVWLALNLAVLACLLRLAWSCLADAPAAVRLMFVGLAAAAAPTISVLLLGQLDLVALGSFAGCYVLLERKRPVAAGVVLALALAKPQLVIPAIALLAVTREWRALAGFSVAGGVLLLGPAVIYGPHIAIEQLLVVLRSDNASITSLRTHEEVMINVRGLITSVTGAHNPFLWAPPLLLVSAVALTFALRVWRSRPATNAQSWALALILPLICSPHVHLQSAVLLLAASALYIRARAGAGLANPVEWLLIAFIVMTATWLLSIAGVSLGAVLVLGVFAVFARRWPSTDVSAAERQAHAALGARSSAPLERRSA